jgi:hypothetical protein
MAIRQVAFDAIAASMLLDTVGYEGIALRGEGEDEDYSDVIIRLATEVG